MERFNREVRDREKVMRGLKKKDTPILTGYKYFITMSDLIWGSMVKHLVEGDDRWLTLIRNAETNTK